MPLQLGVDQRHHVLAPGDRLVRDPLALGAQQIEDTESGEHQRRQHGCDAERDQRAPEESHP